MHKNKVVKNPCKICCLPVSNKNGLRCMGACKKWAHYKCLNYTPGKIQDIKAGLLKVNCPCPDCDYEPKEEYKNASVPCGKELCPALRPPACEIKTCPRNVRSGTCQTIKCPLGCETSEIEGKKSDVNQKSDKKGQKKTGECIEKPPVLPRCLQNNPSKEACLPKNHSPPLNCPPDSILQKLTPKSSPQKTNLPKCKIHKCCAQKTNTAQKKNSNASKHHVPPPEECKDIKLKCCNKNCPSISSGLSLRGSKSECTPITSNSNFYCCNDKYELSGSNSDPSIPLSSGEARCALLNTIEEMVDTVGNFSRQFKYLMGELMSALERCG